MAVESEHESVEGIIKELESVEQLEGRRVALTKSLIQEIERLQYSSSRLDAELLKTKETELQWWEKSQALKKTVEGYEQRDNKDAFVLVLIDGDGYVCRDNLLQRGEEGGREASKALREGVLARHKEELGDVRIVVQIYAHLQGLARACCAEGRIADQALLFEFAKGFTVACDYVDFIDVGEGGSKADRKLLERYRLHKRQGQCKKILLACSNDRDYLHELEKDREDDAVRNKLCMIRAAPPERDFVNLRLPYVEFNEIFSNVKLQIHGDRKKNGIMAATAPGGWSAVVQNSAPPTSTVETANLLLHGSASINRAGNQGQGDSRAGSSSGSETIALNRYDQRVDIPLPALKSGTLEKWWARGMGACNNFILGAGCSMGNCKFSHQKLTDPEKLAQRVIVRGSRCRKMGDCRNIFCYYGHQCPRQPNCSLEACDFKQLHDKDTMIFRRVGAQ